MAACACFLDGAFKLLCVINITPRKKTSCFFNQCDVLFSQLKKKIVSTYLPESHHVIPPPHYCLE